ncbi:MAG: hypothetical protein ACOX52_20915 [Verrucomicrobiota bacterium]
MEPTHPDRLVENVTAPSAGVIPIRTRRPYVVGQWALRTGSR